MNRHDRIALAAAALLLLVPMGSAWAQGNAPIAVSKMFETVKTGQWIRLEGTLQKDQSVLCSKIKIPTASIPDSNWSIRGALRSVDATKRQLTIGRYHIRLVENPKFTSPMSTLKGLSDLHAGMVVKVEGTYGKDGSFVARKVNDESAQNAQKAEGELQILLVGKIERLNPAKRTIAVMGTTFIAGDNTKVTSLAK